MLVTVLNKEELGCLYLRGLHVVFLLQVNRTKDLLLAESLSNGFEFFRLIITRQCHAVIIFDDLEENTLTFFVHLEN